MSIVQDAQHYNGGNPQTAHPVTFASNVTAGNLIAVAVQVVDASVGLQSVTDNLGNTYVVGDDLAGSSSDRHLATAYAKNIAGGACTVTANTASAVVSVVSVQEVSGCDTVAPLDQHAINTQATPGTGANAVTSTAVTTTTDGQYIFGAGYSTTFSTFSAVGTGYTNPANTGLAGQNNGTEYQIQTSAGSIAATATSSDGAETVMAIMTFKAAVGGITPSVGAGTLTGAAPSPVLGTVLTPQTP